jgi:hypothetical protein
MLLQLPSGLQGPFNTSFMLTWTGPPSTSGTVTYRLVHQPSAAMGLGNGWYGSPVSKRPCCHKAWQAITLCRTQPHCGHTGSLD